MCMNCGCGDDNDTMGDPKNIVKEEIKKRLAEAAIAGNDGDAKSALEEFKKALNHLSAEQIQAEVEKIKGL